MPRFPSLSAAIAGALGLLVASCQPPEQSAQGPVVLAAASMQEALTDLADAWAAQGHDRPVLSFAGTQALVRQVEAGSPADLFVSADAQWMDWLAERGLVIEASRVDIAANQLVYVWLEDRFAVQDVSSGRALKQARIVAMGDPASVPAGRYAKAALAQAGLWTVAEGKVVPTENVRAALALVERGEADLGVVYASDAFAAAQAGEHLATAPLALPEASAILYPATRLTASGDDEAQAFLDFLGGPEGAAIMCANGFVMPPGRPPC